MGAPTIGRFVWHELQTNNRQVAQEFYARLLRWVTKDVAMVADEPYGLCVLDGAKLARITKTPAARPRWLPYIAADDVDAAAAKAKSLGAKVLQGPADVDGV